MRDLLRLECKCILRQFIIRIKVPARFSRTITSVLQCLIRRRVVGWQWMKERIRILLSSLRRNFCSLPRRSSRQERCLTNLHHSISLESCSSEFFYLFWNLRNNERYPLQTKRTKECSAFCREMFRSENIPSLDVSLIKCFISLFDSISESKVDWSLCGSGSM